MSINRITTIALSMYSNKGAYALLCGAGISRSAGIKTGWDIEEDLIRKIAATQEVFQSEDWHEWYRSKFNKEATYSYLLSEVVSTSTERVKLMREYFEATDEEKEDGLKQPTKAHKAIAKLAKLGYVRIIVSPNFDRLFETALQNESVDFQVVYNVDDLSKITPIVHGGVVIVKLNGDYQDCRFRNTQDELDSYDPEMESFLRKIFEDFGLITTGWSAQWDKGLIGIMKNAKPSRYGSFFTYVGKHNDALCNLAESRNGELMNISNADQLFTELLEQISALEKLNSMNALTKDVFVRRVKKYIANVNVMDLTDLIEEEAKRAHDKIMQYAIYDFQIDAESFSFYKQLHLEAIDNLIPASIEIVRWGNDEQMSLLCEVLKRLCFKPIRNGERASQNTVYLHLLASNFLFNAIGFACVKYHKYGALERFFHVKVKPGGIFDTTLPINMVHMIAEDHWDRNALNEFMGKNYLYPASMLKLNVLKPYFIDRFLDEDNYEQTYFIWEQLFSLMYAYYECDPFKDGRETFYPLCYFIKKRINYKLIEGCEYNDFFNLADKLQDQWEPIAQGLFNGKYSEYKSCKDKADEYYLKHGLLN